jgi:hypothetical protein
MSICSATMRQKINHASLRVNGKNGFVGLGAK